MSLSYIKQIGFCLIVIIFSADYLKAGNLVDGAMIKQQAQTYFKKNNLGLSLIVSDKRTFFPCSSFLEFSQRTKNNWTTILVTCPNENWSTLVRSKQSPAEMVDDDKNLVFEPRKIVALTKNISKGQVVSRDDMSNRQTFHVPNF
jgi:hypothetical protein